MLGGGNTKTAIISAFKGKQLQSQHLKENGLDGMTGTTIATVAVLSMEKTAAILINASK